MRKKDKNWSTNNFSQKKTLREQCIPDLRLSKNMAVYRLENVDTGSGFELRNIGVQSLRAHHFHWFHQLNAARNQCASQFGGDDPLAFGCSDLFPRR